MLKLYHDTSKMAKNFEKIPYNSVKPTKRVTYLYTKGGEYSLDGKEYIGEYHLVGTEARTGPVPDKKASTLRKFYTDPILYEYDKARDFKTRNVIEPNQSVVFPKETDYQIGYLKRYFVERSAGYDGYPIEIDRIQASTYGKEGGLDGASYNLAIINWKLTGIERSIYKDGMVLIKGIFEYNQEEVYKATRIIPTLPSAIKDYLQFARISLKSYIIK